MTTAPAADQLRLLDVQALDTRAAQLAHRRRTLPVLVDGDFVLSQNAAILGYVADRAPQARLLGDGSARQRAEATRWLMFSNADIQPSIAASPADFAMESPLSGSTPPRA